ncbi:MAG: hypothetical protein AVDCRST_MAG39-2272, partial [uncultured Sphingomonadaceae bacterium]
DFSRNRLRAAPAGLGRPAPARRARRRARIVRHRVRPVGLPRHRDRCHRDAGGWPVVGQHPRLRRRHHGGPRRRVAPRRADRLPPFARL